MCNTCCKNTTNTTGCFLSQFINGLFGGGNSGCNRCNTITVPIYGTVRVPISELQGATGNGATNTQSVGGCCNGCPCYCCRPICCNGCAVTQNVCTTTRNGCYSAWNGGGCANTRCGRSVATSIVTGTDTDDTTEIRYGYYPYGYYPYGGGCGCGR